MQEQAFDVSKFRHYLVRLIVEGDEVGVRRKTIHEGPPVVEIYRGQTESISPDAKRYRADFTREGFVTRLTLANILATSGVGFKRVKSGSGPIDGEISRVEEPWREAVIDPETGQSKVIETPYYAFVTHERPRNLDDVHLQPEDLDWKAVRAWLANVAAEAEQGG